MNKHLKEVLRNGEFFGKTLDIFERPPSGAYDLHSVYHYTKKENAEKIIGEKEISFLLSRVDGFLDKNEGIQVLEPYYHACGELYESGMIDQPFYLFLRGIGENDIMSRTDNCWILCFSKNGSSSFLKRRYAPKDGLILRMDAWNLDFGRNEFLDEFGHVDFYEVRYSFEKMVTFLKNKLNDCFKLYSLHTANGHITDTSLLDNESRLLKNEIAQWLVEHSLSYKGKDYEGEEEIRLIFQLKSVFSHWENEESSIKLDSYLDNGKAGLKLSLKKSMLIEQIEKTDPFYCRELNKPIFTTGEIQEAMKKYNAPN